MPLRPACGEMQGSKHSVTHINDTLAWGPSKPATAIKHVQTACELSMLELISCSAAADDVWSDTLSHRNQMLQDGTDVSDLTTSWRYMSPQRFFNGNSSVAPNGTHVGRQPAVGYGSGGFASS